MDGVNVLASGFEKDEKADIAKMIAAMGGVLHTKASPDVTFVIAKDVLAQKYKWALNHRKIPIVTKNWLHQCWKEHRVVPQEPYKVLPFSGLTVCVSGIPADERKEMEKLVMQNGGKYSAELTKRCSHLVCDISFMFSFLAPEGDKFKVAKRWGHIYIVNRKWFHQSVARRACLCEESYPVQGIVASSVSGFKISEQNSQGKVTRNPQYCSSSIASALDSETTCPAQDMEPNLEVPLSNMCSAFFEVPPLPKVGDDPPADEHKHDPDVSRCIADDSECEDDDLYLSECRILLVGFETSELRKLVDMVRQGGGSRYMSFNEKLTHIIVGNPSEIEIKEVRSLASLGIIYIVKTTWLEECTSKKKEVPVHHSHIAYDLLLPKDSVTSNKATATSMIGSRHGGKASISQTVENAVMTENSECEVSSGLKDVKTKVQIGLSNGNKHIKSSTIFKGKLFCFSVSFPLEQRPEIVLWINEGGGEVVADQIEKNVHFIVERHGVPSRLTSTSRSAYVTTHWVRSCLEDGCLLDVSSHILYSPLSCHIPLPGFEKYRICVSRYDTKERQLLRNLCYVLGAKFIEKLTKKVTHLLCKFADGDKYEAACRWGIHVVTAEWIFECTTQNKIVDLERFHPKELISQDRHVELCSVSQYSTQSVRMTLDTSQRINPLHDLRNIQKVASTECQGRDEENSSGSKRARVVEYDSIKCPLSFDSTTDNSLGTKSPTESNVTEIAEKISIVPDVAAAIEDLLEQTSKIEQDRKSQEASGSRENQFMFSNSTIGQRHDNQQSILGPSKLWLNRVEKRDDLPSAVASATNPYDGFSETQTDSQVVGYEEDLTGRQMIIDRVRTMGSRG
ncbi:transcription coactivators [Striga hermonthica]|uniref:Transcription coactivators n=1 Tax=Striga hermonthica TaxID=68872 RepID=A0A9N7N8X0_STRHE|nr:transcription coactivators [Striga hermonthica]